MRFEHLLRECVLRARSVDVADAEGRDGWELVAVVPVEGRDGRRDVLRTPLERDGYLVDMWFKRPVDR